MTASFLHVTPILPRPHGNGLAMRTSMLSEALARLGDTEILVVGQTPPQGAPCDGGGSTVRHLDTSGRHDGKLGMLGAISDFRLRAAALRALGRPFASRAVSTVVAADFARMVAERPRRGILVSRSYLLPLLDVFGGHPPCPVIVDLDDDDGDLARQHAALARLAGDEDRALWLEAEADACDALVRKASGGVRLFTAASADAAASLARRLAIGEVATIVNGIELPPVEQARKGAAATLLFVGNLGYPPNIDALTWFVREAWPRIAAERPDARLVAAGSNAGDALAGLLDVPGMTLLRDPADLAPLYDEATAAIVPLRSGSGSRIKILEAGAYRVPVVSTGIGAAGLELDPETDFYRSPADPAAFADACLQCLRDPGEAARRAASLRRFVERNGDRRRVVADIATLLAATFPS